MPSSGELVYVQGMGVKKTTELAKALDTTKPRLINLAMFEWVILIHYWNAALVFKYDAKFLVRAKLHLHRVLSLPKIFNYGLGVLEELSPFVSKKLQI